MSLKKCGKTVIFQKSHLTGFKPMVRFVICVISVIRFWLVNYVILEKLPMFGEIFIRESGANFAQTLIFFIFGVITTQKEASVTSGAFSTAEISAEPDNLEDIQEVLEQSVKGEILISFFLILQ